MAEKPETGDVGCGMDGVTTQDRRRKQSEDRGRNERDLRQNERLHGSGHHLPQSDVTQPDAETGPRLRSASIEQAARLGDLLDRRAIPILGRNELRGAKAWRMVGSSSASSAARAFSLNAGPKVASTSPRIVHW